LGIPSKESGEFVCPHYSGFLAWILGEIEVTRLAARIQSTETFHAFGEKANAAVRFLLKTSETASLLWSSYTFANAYIAYGLSVLFRSERLDARYIEVLINWMRGHQGRSGGFEDIEDTAIAIAALSASMDAAEEGRLAYDKIARFMPKPACRIQRCFLGYSSKSTGIALEIKESLTQRLPILEIKDWRWDFQLSRVLISEIEKVSRECQVAIFLVTKDDRLVQSEETLIDSPRDNVVFEIGFFAARLGMEHTLLVVEKGAKIPSDWGGILAISLQDRGNLAEVNLKLIDAIRKVLPL
jgi:predicted nucleotide-binding protein